MRIERQGFGLRQLLLPTALELDDPVAMLARARML